MLLFLLYPKHVIKLLGYNLGCYTYVEMLQDLLIKGCKGKRRPLSKATSKKHTILGTWTT